MQAHLVAIDPSWVGGFLEHLVPPRCQKLVTRVPKVESFSRCLLKGPVNILINIEHVLGFGDVGRLLCGWLTWIHLKHVVLLDELVRFFHFGHRHAVLFLSVELRGVLNILLKSAVDCFAVHRSLLLLLLNCLNRNFIHTVQTWVDAFFHLLYFYKVSKH